MILYSNLGHFRLPKWPVLGGTNNRKGKTMNKGTEAKIQGKPKENTHFLFSGKAKQGPKLYSEDRNSDFEKAIRHWSPNRLKKDPFGGP